jgi:hypothetical protein
MPSNRKEISMTRIELLTVAGVFALILGMICIGSIVVYSKIENLSKFTEKCFNVDGVVLTNATGSGKTRSYTYVCVDPAIIKNID